MTCLDIPRLHFIPFSKRWNKAGTFVLRIRVVSKLVQKLDNASALDYWPSFGHLPCLMRKATKIALEFAFLHCLKF
jgi:hypothetical protein